jgi:hypothetical protein
LKEKKDVDVKGKRLQNMVDAIESEKEDLLKDFPSETNSDEKPSR